MTAAKIDLKKTHRTNFSAKPDPQIVEPEPLQYLKVDGEGSPGSDAYGEAVAALYSTAYTVKFREKAAGRDFVVPPLEALWWADDMGAFRAADKDAWKWTAMIALPDSVAAEVVEGCLDGIAAGDEPPPAIGLVRLEGFDEGRSAQIMHIGPYADEEPTIDRLHGFIAEEGLTLRGHHHEVYLSDPRRTAPEKMRTIIRQPVA